MKIEDKDETIAAISTPPGAGGIGIIRLSGSLSLDILQKFFIPKNPDCSYQSHRLYYGHICNPVSGRIYDEVLAVYMAAPNTYTREDVVEIQCHSSFLILHDVLELLLAGGARLASPGEFTKRAYLNGRIDLTQAEAVIDILSAKTAKGVDLAMDQLSGSIYKRIVPVQKALIEIRALIEVAIDFPDEDIEILDYQMLTTKLKEEVEEPLLRLLSNADFGRLYREGISIVIAGVPNVGKSSLLNTILQEDRALVTPVPGTTRDSIEEVVDIFGMPAKIIDTAGIRDDAEQVESLGIKRAKELINRADLVLFMLDQSRGLTADDVALFKQVRHKPLLVLLNKTDVASANPPDLSALGTEVVPIRISAKEQTGIEELKKSIFAQVTEGEGQWEEIGCAPNLRHQRALRAAHDASRRVLESFEARMSNDLVAVDLQECLESLAEIVGETTTEDILDVIFTQFCLGK